MKKNPPSRALRFALGRTILNEIESFFYCFFSYRLSAWHVE